jgi:hypothetical protein
MKVELLDINYEGMSLLIKELRKLYEVGDDTTKRMIDNKINHMLYNHYLFINDKNNN